MLVCQFGQHQVVENRRAEHELRYAPTVVHDGAVIVREFTQLRVEPNLVNLATAGLLGAGLWWHGASFEQNPVQLHEVVGRPALEIADWPQILGRQTAGLTTCIRSHSISPAVALSDPAECACHYPATA